MSERYVQSEILLERALKSIPLASQTFSKSKTHYPYGVSPYFISRGEGSKVWDADGNEYVDFINSLAAVNLGYNDPDVTSAVKSQLEEGVIFSLPHSLEMQVAEKIVQMVPSAEMVRFGKNGSDATAGAVRLARAYTGRDRVAVCGYHGWQDWYIGATARNRGVPKAVSDLTHNFLYNDIDSLTKLFRQYPDEFAAIIIEPMNIREPKGNFLHEVAELTRKHGALLIFDETITGFRFASGGAQQLFDITPDLSTFGKGLANGYPLSAVVGKAQYMHLMEEIFFSFTFGGETLSLAASLATLTKIETRPVISSLYERGTKLMKEVNSLVNKHDAESIVEISGNPTWSHLIFKDTPRYSTWKLKTLYMQEIFKRGILSLGSHNMSYAHSDEDINKLITVYDEVFQMISNAVHYDKLEQLLECEPLEPLFKLRS